MRLLLAPSLLAFAAAACSGAIQVTPSHDAGNADADPSNVPDDAGSGADAGATGSDAGVDSGRDAAEAGGHEGLNLSAATGYVFESEDQIAVGPDGTIAVLWTAIGNGSIAMVYRFSTDDGATFTPPKSISVPQVGLEPCDPALAVDASGNFYAAFLGLHPSGQSVDYTRAYVAKAAAGTTTFGDAVEVSDPSATRFYDHPKIFVTAKGTIVVGFMQSDSATTGTAVGTVATSTNATAWTRYTIVDNGGGFANLFSFCEGTSGLYVTYLEATSSTYFIGIRKSTNEGATWSSTTQISLDSETPAGLDPMCAASGNEVWVSYSTTASQSANEQTLDAANAIRVAHSSNGAQTFDSARMDALDTAATPLGCIPNLVREPGGALDVAWVGGAKEGDLAGSVRIARASGTTFGKSTEIDGPMDFTVSRTTRTWLGDYFGSAYHNGAVYLAYPMNASGSTHIFFKKVLVN